MTNAKVTARMSIGNLLRNSIIDATKRYCWDCDIDFDYTVNKGLLSSIVTFYFSGDIGGINFLLKQLKQYE